MKYILVLLSFLYVVPTYAMEKSECLKKVESLDIELSRCSINMPENAESTAEMNDILDQYNDRTKCVLNIRLNNNCMRGINRPRIKDITVKTCKPNNN